MMGRFWLYQYYSWGWKGDDGFWQTCVHDGRQEVAGLGREYTCKELELEVYGHVSQWLIP
jgi:hypothetical protein